MSEELEGVSDSESPAEGSEHETPEQPDVEAQGGGESEAENRIPISRAEEMWRKREAKLREDWSAKELNPLKKQMEEWNNRLAKGQLGFMEQMGWYKPEPEKPFTRSEVEQMLKQQIDQVQYQIRTQTFEERIRQGWDQVGTKYPKLAGNRYFQEAALAAYARNPEVSISQHADQIVKELLDPHAVERDAGLQREREAQRSPSRRVMPGGRGAGGGGGSKGEKPKSVAEQIQSRLAAIKEG